MKKESLNGSFDDSACEAKSSNTGSSLNTPVNYQGGTESAHNSMSMHNQSGTCNRDDSPEVCRNRHLKSESGNVQNSNKVQSDQRLDVCEVKHEPQSTKTLFTIDSIIGTRSESHSSLIENEFDEVGKKLVDTSTTDDTKIEQHDMNKKDVYETIPSPPPKISELQQKMAPSREMPPFIAYPGGYGPYTAGMFRPQLHGINPNPAPFNHSTVLRNNYYSQLLSGMAPHSTNFVNNSTFSSPPGLSRTANPLHAMSPYLVQAAAVAASGGMPQMMQKTHMSQMSMANIYSAKTVSPPATSPAIEFDRSSSSN